MTAAKDILLCVLEKARRKVEEIAKEDKISADEAIKFIDEVDVPYVNIIRQLFVSITTDTTREDLSATTTKYDTN